MAHDTVLRPTRTETPTTPVAIRPPKPSPADYALGVLRIVMGWTFLWAFFDKTFGLGYATPSENAWIDGGSPTTGYLSGVEGPFAGLFNGLAGHAWADWLFMAGLLGIGAALILGIGVRIAAVTGAALLLFMFAASLPLVTNPIVDSHITEAIVLAVLALTGAGATLGLGRVWQRIPFVARHRWLV